MTALTRNSTLHAYRWTRKDSCPHCLTRDHYPWHISERPDGWFLALYTCQDCAHVWGTTWAEEGAT